MPMEAKEELPDLWTLFTDGSSCVDGSGAGLILTNPKGAEFTYPLRFRFDVTNNEAEYEALIAGLRIAKQIGVKISKQIWTPFSSQPGSCSMHVGTSKGHTNGMQLANNACRSKKDDKGMSRLPGSPPRAKKPATKPTPITSLWSFYKTEAVIPVEIGMPTLRTTKIDMVQNDEALESNLDLLEERREQAAIREVRSKAKMEKYYNSKERNTSFKPGDLVYRNNDANHAKDSRKLSPKWEGPYEVTEALVMGAYKLRDRNGNLLP
ncbi:reverse transcriptase domain-containing protein [Tanacetum coccineum]|uniref:Reverse transcriptase domain-containing protein n=1 Tax=Tanacetum coccineum TaxID=301880 RepID=A0ABQ4YGG6_9ASTR